MTTSAHLGLDLTAFVDGELSATQADRARAHLLRCPGCSEAVAELRRLRRLVALADTPDPSGGLEASLLAVGRPAPTARPRVVPARHDPLAASCLTAIPPRARRRLTPLAAGVGVVVGLGVVTSLSVLGPLPGGGPGRTALVPAAAQVANRQPVSADFQLAAGTTAWQQSAVVAQGPLLASSPGPLLAVAPGSPASPTEDSESGGSPTMDPATAALLENGIEATAWFVAGSGGGYRR